MKQWNNETNKPNPPNNFRKLNTTSKRDWPLLNFTQLEFSKTKNHKTTKITSTQNKNHKLKSIDQKGFWKYRIVTRHRHYKTQQFPIICTRINATIQVSGSCWIHCKSNKCEINDSFQNNFFLVSIRFLFGPFFFLNSIGEH